MSYFDRINTKLLAIGLGGTLLCSAPIYAQSLQESFADIIRNANEATQEESGAALPAVPLPTLITGSSEDRGANSAETDASAADPFAEGDPEAVVVTPDTPVDLDLPDLPEGFLPSFGEIEFTLMFPEAQMVNMRKILSFYESRVEEEVAGTEQQGDEYDDYLSQILGEIDGVKPGEPEEILEPLPTYYLGTILYRSANAWSVWINGRRFNAGDDVKGLTIKSVSPRRVSFSWQPDKLSRVLTSWEGKRDGEVSLTYGNRSAARQNIRIDYDEGIVHFALNRHQTFNAEEMEVYEGKLEGGIDPFTYVAPEPEETEVSTGPTDGSFQPEFIDPDRALMNDLLENTQQIRNISVPRNRTDNLIEQEENEE